MNDFERVLPALKRAASGWTLRACAAALVTANEKRIVGFCVKRAVAVRCTASREAVDAGGLMYYGADLGGRLTGASPYYVDRILKGSQACRSARRAADEVRAGHQSQNGQADRRDDSAVAVVPGG